MAATRGEAASLAGAVLAHAVVLALVLRAPVPSAVRVTGPMPEASVEIELTSEPAPSSTVAERESAPAPIPTNLEPARVVAHVRDEPRAAPPDSSASAAPAPTVETPLDTRAPLALSADAIGLGGRNVFLGGLPDGKSTPPPHDAPPGNVAPGVQQSLRDALHEHDHGIGLDIGGPIVAVLEDLTRPSSTPLNSRAVFQVTADADGNVTGVSLVDVSQGRGEWEHVATSLRDALRSRKLHVPGGTGGVAITLEVASRWQLPSGHDPDTEVSVLGIPVKRAAPENKHAKKVEVLKPELKIVEAPAQPEAQTGVKLPRYQLQVVKILGLDIDETDLTPRPLRVVHARVVREKIL
jgi:hypothetical protein